MKRENGRNMTDEERYYTFLTFGFISLDSHLRTLTSIAAKA